MNSTSIRVSEETKKRLDLYKRENESYEDVIRRLTERDKWAGFGVLSDEPSDTRTGMQELHQAMREGMATDVENDDRPR